VTYLEDEHISSVLQQMASEGARDSSTPAVETLMVGRSRRTLAIVGAGGLIVVLALAVVLVATASGPPNNSSKGSFHAVAAPNQSAIGHRDQLSAADTATLAALTSVPQNELVSTPDPADVGWSCKIALNTLFELPVPFSELKAMPPSQAEAELANVPKTQLWGVTCLWSTSTPPTTPGPLQAIKSSACNVTAGSPPTTAPSNASDGLQPCSGSGDPNAASNQAALDQLFQSLGWGLPSWLTGHTPTSAKESNGSS
jgi:hypothetical protein